MFYRVKIYRATGNWLNLRSQIVYQTCTLKYSQEFTKAFFFNGRMTKQQQQMRQNKPSLVFLLVTHHPPRPYISSVETEVVDEAADSATCEPDTLQTSTTFPIEVTTSFKSLLNISADEEVLPGATETLRTLPRCLTAGNLDGKKKTSMRPPIAFESPEPENEALSDTSWAQAK